MPAAVALVSAHPFSVDTVTLDGAWAGEVVVGITAIRIWHNEPLTLSEQGPRSLLTGSVSCWGACIVAATGPGVASVSNCDHVLPLSIPECRHCRAYASGMTNLCTAIHELQGVAVCPATLAAFHLRAARRSVTGIFRRQVISRRYRRSRWRGSGPTRPSTRSAASAAA